MRWLRSLSTAFIVPCLSLCVCVLLLFPSSAHAVWKDVKGQQREYLVSSSTTPASFTPLLNPAAHRGQFAFNVAIDGYWNASDSGFFANQAWNTVPSVNAPYLVLGFIANTSALTQGNSVMVYAPALSNFNVSWDGGSKFFSRTIKGSNFNWYVSTDNMAETVRVYPSDVGVIVLPFDTKYIIATTRLDNFSSYINNSPLYYYDGTGVSVMVEYPEDQNEVEAINNQTETFMDTTGSDTVLGNPNGVQQQINDKLGFVSQTASYVTNVYDSVINAEPTGTIQFPGLTWDGHTIIEQQSVPLLGWIEPIEGQVRLAITAMLVLAWLHGVRLIYGRIFLGETDVVTDGEE